MNWLPIIVSTHLQEHSGTRNGSSLKSQLEPLVVAPFVVIQISAVGRNHRGGAITLNILFPLAGIPVFAVAMAVIAAAMVFRG